MKVRIKPLSINKAWQGRRYKTPAYKAYEQELIYKLPASIELFERIELLIIVGYSSKLADIDNFLKPFLDVLQKKYSFDDKIIYKLVVEKTIVSKKEEFIFFKISEYQNDS